MVPNVDWPRISGPWNYSYSWNESVSQSLQFSEIEGKDPNVCHLRGQTVPFLEGDSLVQCLFCCKGLVVVKLHEGPGPWFPFAPDRLTPSLPDL